MEQLSKTHQIHRLASSANFSLALEELDRQVKNRTIVKCSIGGILTLSNGNFNNLDDDYRFHNNFIKRLLRQIV